MRVICPRCGAEYEIDEGLIPGNGREVECSSCGNVWFQQGRLRMPAPLGRLPLPGSAQSVPPAVAPPDAGADDADPSPRSLPEDVMAILRDEAAHFRSNRPELVPEAAIDTAPPPDEPRPAPPAPPEAATPPDATPEGMEADPEPAEAAAVEAVDAPILGPVTDTAPIAPAPEAEPAPAPLTPAPTMRVDPVPAPADWARVPARRSGFGRGLAIGLVLAAVWLGLYLAAPHAGEGVLGDALRRLRAGGDAAHLWVQAQLAAWR